MSSNLAWLEFVPDGTARGLYTEVIDLAEIGHLTVQRHTIIEYDNPAQLWRVFDLQGRCVHSSPSRGDCLQWERDNLTGPVN